MLTKTRFCETRPKATDIIRLHTFKETALKFVLGKLAILLGTLWVYIALKWLKYVSASKFLMTGYVLVMCYSEKVNIILNQLEEEKKDREAVIN